MAATTAVLPFHGVAQRLDAPNGVALDVMAHACRFSSVGSIHAALEVAAKAPVNKTVYFHAGTCRPLAHGAGEDLV